MPTDDTDIMLCVQAGQVHLFDELVRRYRPTLVRVAYSKLGDLAWAEDVAQESLLAAYAARQSYKPQFAFRTWLWTILLNLCRRHWQRRESRPKTERLPPADRWSTEYSEPSGGETGLALLLRTERREQVQQMLARLPEVQADALRLRFLAELPFCDIALTMNSSVSGAKQRVRHGLAALALLLRDAAGDQT